MSDGDESGDNIFCGCDTLKAVEAVTTTTVMLMEKRGRCCHRFAGLVEPLPSFFFFFSVIKR